MSMTPSESDLLRQMVRQVLHEVVPQTMAAAPDHAVAIRDDADLQAFARRIASMPQPERDAILAGRRTFRLNGAAPAPESGGAATASTTAASGTAGVVRIDKGAVTERHVRQAAEQGAALVLGPRAVLTPLARDRARAAGVEITKEK